MSFWDAARVLGGLGLLLHGMELAGVSLQSATGGAMRRLLAGLSESRWRAAGAGAATAFLVNSSAVTAVAAASLSGAGALASGAAIAAMAGGGLGSALTVQLLAFRTARAGPVLVAAGMCLSILVRSGRARDWARLALAMGLVLWGMAFLTEGLFPLARSGFLQKLHFECRGPLLGFAAGLALALATGSSSAAVAVFMAIAQAAGGSASTAESSLGAVLGANVGTAVAPWLAASRAGRGALEAASGFLLYKSGLALALMTLAQPASWLVLVLGRQAAELLGQSVPGPARVVANLHLAVNLVGLVVAVPLSGALVRLAGRLLPAAGASASLEPRHLDPDALGAPEIALENAKREILRFAATVREMVAGSLGAFGPGGEGIAMRLTALDERVDRLQRAVTAYLSRLLRQGVSASASVRAMALVGAADDLESVADVVVRDLLRLAGKRRRLGQDFSEAGWVELRGYHGRVVALLDGTLAALASEDPAAAAVRLADAKEILSAQAALRRSHVARLAQGISESRETSAVHLDVLHALGEAAGRLADLNRALMGRA